MTLSWANCWERKPMIKYDKIQSTLTNLFKQSLAKPSQFILFRHDCIEWRKESKDFSNSYFRFSGPAELEENWRKRLYKQASTRHVSVWKSRWTWELDHIGMRVDDDDLLTLNFPGILWDTQWPKARPAQIRLLQEFGQRTGQVADKPGKEAPWEEMSSVTHVSFQFCSLCY